MSQRLTTVTIRSSILLALLSMCFVLTGCFFEDSRQLQTSVLTGMEDASVAVTEVVDANVPIYAIDEPVQQSAVTLDAVTYSHHPRIAEFQRAYMQDVLAYQQEPTAETSAYIVIFGDIMLGRYVRTLMDKNGTDYPFEQMDHEYLAMNDILLANLEGPITERAFRTETGMRFSFFPDVVDLLKKHHFDMLSLANNHTLDMGEDGYQESLQLLRAANLIPFGHQRDITGDSIATRIIRGQKIAFLGLEEVNSGINDEAALQKIREFAGEGYKVIVFPHWGIEYQHTPSARQQQLAHDFIDAGAFAVIGHHPHVMQTYETYNGRPIFYSLGNAIFDQYWSAETQKGLSLALAINDETITIYLLPIILPYSQFQLMEEPFASQQLHQMAEWGQNPPEEFGQIAGGKVILNL